MDFHWMSAVLKYRGAMLILLGPWRQAKAKHRARTRRNPASDAALRTDRKLWNSEQSVTEGVLGIDTVNQLMSCLKATVSRTVFKVTDDSAILRSLSSTDTEATHLLVILFIPSLSFSQCEVQC